MLSSGYKLSFIVAHTAKHFQAEYECYQKIAIFSKNVISQTFVYHSHGFRLFRDLLSKISPIFLND